jgi:hypothetical protein
MNRIMSFEQVRFYREQTMKQETAEVLNLLYRSARATVEAAEDNINARKDLTEEQKDKMIKYEWRLFRLSKWPKMALSQPFPTNRVNLLAFHNALNEAIEKYLVAERGGVYILY